MINQLHVSLAILFIKLSEIHEKLHVFEPNNIGNGTILPLPLLQIYPHTI